ncbi:chemotaxis protein CheB [Nannocystis bainbridge]|uniref:Chemotaxis protein CheB n=1 Tax=Nannocystis bainbridge TaxID=2995303 RepID=A0ABT5E6C3_9BACT|nr:chemotaxis protein CheB [Nannocystis bainbridge]MDC0721401.1 chemotaxis protein CheB [Nannocystis bainbridge]
MVGIGASAGGLEALEQFFDHVPPAPGLAFVVISHLAPHLPSLMPELLAKRTELPVTTAEDGARVEPNHVYVIPPNGSLTLVDGALRVEARDERTNLIDTFFRSLAEARGEYAIGVVLSGTGNDGSLGLKAIREHGGVAMAQELASAKYNTMPRSAIDAGQVDWVLPAQAMPAKMLEYAGHIRSTGDRPAADPSDPNGARANGPLMNRLCGLIHRRTGRDFSRYKRSTVERRVLRRMHVLQQRSLEDYVELVANTPAEVDRLFQDLLISVTQFFRDPELFEALAREVLPQILADRAPDDPVRVWVPGCATGEEAYSIAMLLMEASPTEARGAKIFATDIDDEGLETARAGRYPETIADRVTSERLERFFVPRANGGWQIRKEIRDMCVFSTHSIISDPPFSRLDLISCRNVLIYLDSDLQRTVFPLFHYGLRPRGFLLLGPSENVTACPELFTPIDSKQRIFQRREAKVAVRFPLERPTTSSRRLTLGPQNREPAGQDQSLTRTLERLILAVYAPPAVIVRGDGAIVFVSGQTRKYLELAPGAAGINVLEMAGKSLRPHLHVLLREATSRRQERVQRGVSLAVDGHVLPVDIVVRPLVELGADNDLYAVLFYEAGPSLSPEQAEAEGRAPDVGDAHAVALESELRSTRESLQTAVEELEVANEELKSTNEELQSSNEELQSANEELQTSKEELQSINEELHTVNAELSRKLHELDKANGDLQNLFASSRIATVFLASDLTIKRFSPEASQLFRLIDSDVGRDITDIVPRFTGGDLVADADQVLRTRTPSQREVHRLDADVWYLQQIQPYRTVDGAAVGVVITFVDITDLKSARDSARRLAAIVESSHDAIVALDERAGIVTWNHGAELMFGHGPREAVGRGIDFLATSGESPFASAFAAALRGEGSQPVEAMLQRRDGTSLRVLASLSPIRDTQGSRAAVSWIARDITEHERTRQALRESQERFHEVDAANRRKTEFLALLGHELRNPLAPIRNATHYLQRTVPATPEMQRAVGMIERQAAHMARLIDDLLDISRISSGKILLKKRREDLAAVAHTVVEDLRGEAARADVTVEFTAREAIPVDGDAVRLSQCISNILGNAFKFTDPGGRISVVVERRGDAALVRVSDTGIGMDPETLARAFEPFAQSDIHLARGHGGLGLGLSLVKALVELHGGEVTATSGGPGRGTEVAIRLPLAASAPQGQDAGSPAPADNPDGRRRVLVIEDNEDAAQSLSMLLDMWGHVAAVACSGAAGVEAALADPPDVVLCDLSLSGAMDGYEVCRILRGASTTAGALIIAMTGHGLESDKRKVERAGFDMHLIKPVDPEVLARIIHDSPLVHAPG